MYRGTGPRSKAAMVDFRRAWTIKALGEFGT
jgi:hypothetical protein